MDATPKTTAEAMRCSNCGGLNPLGAEWCGQCLTRFRGAAPPPPPPPPTLTVVPSGGASDPLFDPDPFADPAVGPTEAEPAAEIVERGAFRAVGNAITWTCSVCDNPNTLEASLCSVCGAPFAATVRPPEPTGPIKDPNNAALVSLFFPGAGHAYIGEWGQAIARGVLSLWVVATALVAAVTKGPNSGSLGLTFGLAAFLLWGVGAHDAYREARRERALVILQGRRFLWLTLALLGVMFLTLMMGLMGARTSAGV